MDTDLPVWTIRPNWANGISEKLEWLTDVLASDTGVEQRRSVRLSPRRSFEITVNPTRGERTYLDLLLHRLGINSWLVPLWHDQAALLAGAAIGANRIEIDNTFREFTNGGLAIIYLDAFTWEVISVVTQDDTGLNLDVPLEKAWPVRAKVYPIRQATLQTDTKLSALTTRVGQSQLLFTLEGANDFPEVMPDDLLYMGAPILFPPPDRSASIDLSHVRLFDEQDGQIGGRYRVDQVGHAFATQSHNWLVQGREAQAAFRSMMYWLRGRQRMLWMPSFNDDIFVSRDVAANATFANIEKCGFGYVGHGPIPGRARLWTGKEVLIHASMGAALSSDEERINLAGVTAYAYPAGSTWSFLEAARLDTDTIEFTHHADSDGAMECGAAFRTFQNDRSAPSPIYVAVPRTPVFSTDTCGDPADGTNPCRPVPFNGAYRQSLWYHKVPCNPAFAPTRNLTVPTYQPNPPYGKTIDQFNNFGSLTVYERDDGVNPSSPNFGNPLYANLRGQVLVSIACTNQTIDIFLYGGPPSGSYYLQVQYPAFYCGSVGLDGGDVAVQTCSVTEDHPSCIPTDTDLGYIGGNYPYEYTWEN